MRTDEMDAIHMDPVGPVPAWEKGTLLSALTEQTVDALLAAAGPQHPIPLIMVEVRLMGGALGRPAAVPNAVPGRRGSFAVLVLGPGVPELAQVVPVVGTGVLAALRPWTAYAPSVIERLRELKQAVDPAGVFSGHAL